MTDFFIMPGGVVNPPDSSRSTMSYAQPPGNTVPKPDDGGIVRFNTVDWEARAKVAADGAEGLRAALAALADIDSSNQFGDLVEGIEVHNRLNALVDTWRRDLKSQIDSLTSLSTKCSSAGARLDREDSLNAYGFTA